MSEPPLRVGIWCAVSSRGQADPERESLPAQETAGREFARAVGGEVVSTYTIGHSRDYWNWYEIEADVPAYRQVREDMEAGRLDVLHTIDADRLGRDPALIQQFYSLAERHKCEIYDASMPHQIGQQSIGHRYGTAVKSVAVGEDQRRRVYRHRSGMRGRVLRRGLIPGRPPHGYAPVRALESGAVVGYEFDEGIAAIEQVTRLYLAGLSLEEIARRMSAGPHPAPGGGVWYERTIGRIMNNDTYAGLPGWDTYRAEEPSARFPALWAPETHAMIIRERQRRSRGYARRGSGPYRGVAYCRRCGSRMSRMRRRYKDRSYRYYRCGLQNDSRLRGTCHYNHIPEHKITTEIAAFLDYLATENNLDEALELWTQGRESETLEAERERALALVDDLVRQRERLGLALAAGKLDAELYRKLDDRLLPQLEAARAQMDEIAAQLDALPDLAARRRILSHLSDAFPRLIDQEEPASMAALLQAAGLTVWCEDGEVVEIELG